MIEAASRGAKHTLLLPKEATAAASDAIRELNCLIQALGASQRRSAGDILQIPPDAIPLACWNFSVSIRRRSVAELREKENGVEVGAVSTSQEVKCIGPQQL